MSKNWKRRQWGLTRLSLESLEDRAVPAGNIRVIVDGGVLRVRSDNDDFHAFSISGAGGNNVVIRPMVGTTINGQADAIWVGGVKEGYDIQTGNGPDTVIISGVNGREYLSIVTNGGDDAVHIVHDTRSLESTWVRTGDGNDVIIVNGSTFRNHFAIVSGEGNDRVDIGPRNRFGNNVTFDGSGGTNTLTNTGNEFNRAPVIRNFSSQGTIPAPIASNDTATVAQNGSVSINVLANDTAIQGTLTPSSVTITGNPGRGTATVNADGTISYTNTSAGSSDSFTYTVKNSLGGTSNPATVTVTITDSGRPTVQISSSASDPTKTSPIPFTATFSETVTGFEKSDITVSGGTVTDFTAVSGTVYNFSVTPTADGTVTVSVPANAAKDSQGNNNDASANFSRTFDTTAPTITINSKTTNNTTPSVTGTVNDSNATVVVTVNGQNATANVSGNTWTASFTTALAPGTYTVTATATDKAGNVGNASLADGLTVDTTPPTVVVSSTAPNPTATSPIPITVTFNENVVDFAVGDVTVTNGTAANFTAVDAKTYTFSVTPTAAGEVTVAVGASKATDAAGNQNAASNTFSITFAQGAPAVVLSTDATDPTRFSPIPVIATFSEDVTGFVAADVTVTGGTVSNFVAVNGLKYTFDVTPTGQGPVTVSVAAGVAKDGDNIDNVASAPLTRVFDTVAPTSTINQIFTNQSMPTLTGTVSEAGASVEVSANAVVIQAVVTGTTWTATFTTAFAEGTYTITAVTKDAAGNQSPNLLGGGLVVDFTAPTVSIETTGPNPTNSAPIPFVVTFSEVVVGFAIDDMVVTNGTVSNFDTGDNQAFTFDVTPTGEGVVTIEIASGVTRDRAGNPNVENMFQVTFDSTVPTVALVTAANDPTNLANIPFAISLSEPMPGFVIGSISVINGAAANFQQLDATHYQFDVIPAADGLVTVSIPAGVASDAAGNKNTASEVVTLVSDRTGPTVTIATTATDPSNLDALPFTITFNETVSGFDETDIVVTNGTLANFQIVDDFNAKFDVIPAGDGAVTVVMPADKAADELGNLNPESNTVTIVSDRTSPTISVDADIAGPTSLLAIPFTITLSEAIPALSLGNITVTNGTAANFVLVDDTHYTFDVVPTADGEVTAMIAAGAVNDPAGNPNAASNTASIIYVDTTGPGVTLTTTASDPTNLAAIPFTVELTEPVVGFDISDISVSNGTATNFVMVDDTHYTFDVTPDMDGSVVVQVPAAVVQDSLGNDNSASNILVIGSDRTAPGVSLATTASSPSNLAAIPFTVELTEPMPSFDVTDITVTNGTATNFQMVDSTHYTFDVTPALDGDVTVQLLAGAAQDSAGNGNTASLAIVVSSDRTAPTVTVATVAADPNNLTVIPYTVELSEPLAGFSIGNITVDNGTADNFVMVDGTHYTFDVTPTTDGNVTVQVLADVANDAAGNGNTDSNIVMVGSDRTAPTVTVATVAANPNNLAVIPYTVELSEPMAGFSIGNITVGNGTADNFVMVDSTHYTFDVTPAADGDVTVQVLAGAATDTAGNGNAASNVLVVVSDQTVPTVAFDYAGGSPTKNSPLTITVNFSEGVTGFESGDIIILNGTVTNFTPVTASQYIIEVTPTIDGDVTVSIGAGVAADAAGNGNAAATDLVVVYDNSAPTGTIAASTAGAVAGTSSDAFSGIATVEVSIFDSSTNMYWDGTGFNSAVEVFLLATILNASNDWSYAIAVTGTYTVQARITDGVGLQTTISASAQVL